MENTSTFSKTQLANISNFIGLLVMVVPVLADKQTMITFMVAAGWSTLSTAYNWYNRYKQGDLTVLGARK